MGRLKMKRVAKVESPQTWLQSGDLERETESLTVAAQN